MANLVHISASLRLVHVNGAGRARNLRTFTGVRRDLARHDVEALMRGVNALKSVPATNAVLTARGALARD